MRRRWRPDLPRVHIAIRWYPPASACFTISVAGSPLRTAVSTVAPFDSSVEAIPFKYRSLSSSPAPSRSATCASVTFESSLRNSASRYGRIDSDIALPSKAVKILFMGHLA